MLDLQKAMDGEAANSFEATKKTAEMEGQLIDLDTARENELRSIDRLSSSIAGSTSAAAAAAKKQREEMEKMAAMQNKWSRIGTLEAPAATPEFSGVLTPVESIITDKASVDRFQVLLSETFAGMRIGIGIEPDTDSIQDFTNELTSLLESTALQTSEIIGNLVGTLAMGGNAWGDFKNAAISAFGDMAIAIGKIAIKAGLAASGISMALKNPANWYLAVAAGAALVALGSAVKSSLSAVASGDYGAGGGSYAGGSSSSSGSDWDTREVNVNVTGTLVADGDQLITVINNANRKNYYTQ